MDEYISPAEAAKILEISVRRVQALCKSGRIGFMVGSRYIILKKSVIDFVKKPSGRPKK